MGYGSDKYFNGTPRVVLSETWSDSPSTACILICDLSSSDNPCSLSTGKQEGGGSEVSTETEASVDGSEPKEQVNPEIGIKKKKKKRKTVSWVDDNKLRSFFYFELDETERGV